MGLRVLSLFSGIGAFEEALKNLKVNFELVNYCEFQEDIAKAYSIIHNTPIEKNLGDITKVDEKQLEDFDLMTYGYPCSPKGQLVITQDGYKAVEDIKENDLVLTHNNKLKRVVRTMSRISKDMYKLKGMGFPELYLTEEHPLYIIRKGENSNNPFWCKTKELKLGDYLSINKPNKEENLYNLTKEECWFLGRYLADGYIKFAEDSTYIIFCIGKKKSSKFESMNKSYNMTDVRKGKRACCEYTCFNKRLVKFAEDIGVGSKYKTIPEYIINLPNNLLNVFLEGYLSGDGHNDTKGNREMFCTTSKKVFLGLQRIYLKLYNKTPSVTIRVDNRKETFSDNYNGYIRHNSVSRDTFIHEGKLYTRLKTIEYNDNYNDYVYNFEVEDDNSYTLENIIVHNCQDISALGNQKGFFNEDGTLTRSGLFFEAMRIAEEKKPKYMIAENVRALVSKPMKNSFEGMLKLIDALGYNSYWKVMNSKDYGIPHSRNRVFIVSIRKDIDDNSFVFPEPIELKIKAKDLYDKGDIADEFYLEEKHEKYYNEMRLKKKYSSLNSDVLVCMTTKQGGKSNPQNFIKDSKGARILTDSELMVFQGFRREYGPLLRQNGFTTTKIGYMAGNSITVNVLTEIFKVLIPQYIPSLSETEKVS